MSHTTEPLSYGTEDPRAFAYFIAGLFAHRGRNSAAATALYQLAVRTDPMYHKAINNLGLLVLSDATEVYAKLDPESLERAEERLVEAEGLFTRAHSLAVKIPEYLYNQGTALSYHGRLAKRLGGAVEATALQEESIKRYREALELLNTEPEIQPPVKRRLPWPSRARRLEAAQNRRVGRLRFKAAVLLSKACSLAVYRQLIRAKNDPESQAEYLTSETEESKAVAETEDIRKEVPALAQDGQIDYNLACYYANADRVDDARKKLGGYLSINPGAVTSVLQDPDLLDVPELISFFRAKLPEQEPVSGSPTTPPREPAQPGFDGIDK